MHRVYLGLGSNIDPMANLPKGLDELASRYELVSISGAVQSAAVGFDGAAFVNLAVGLDTESPLAQLAVELRDIEYMYGRTPDCSKYSSRTLDIDILLYDDLAGEHEGMLLPRPEIRHNAFVLGPLSEVAGDLVLPGARETIDQLWTTYDKSRQPLASVSMAWRGWRLGHPECPYGRVASHP